MVEKTEGSARRATAWRRGRLSASVVSARHLRALLGVAPRLILVLVIAWAFAGPIDRTSIIVGASGLVPGGARPDGAVRAGPMFPETGFAVADGPLGAFFVARGAARTFGPPISNPFPLLGSTVQLFKNHMLKVETNGAVSTVDLFGMQAVPFRNVGGVIIPEIDPYLVATAPVPGTPDYAARAQAFIKETAPDQWEGLPVGFYQAFLNTVRAEDAMPAGGEVALLPLFSQEVWGVPTSRPVRDAQNPDAVVQRWERGVMIWSRPSGTVSTVPLGEAFKMLLTAEGLGPERMAASVTSQFLAQYAPNSPGGVARPLDLPNTVLAGAFGDMPGAVAASQLSDPEAIATATPTPPPVNNQTIPPPPPPPGNPAAPAAAGSQGLPPPPPPPAGGAATPTATLATGAAAGVPPPPPPAVGAAAGAPAPGAPAPVRGRRCCRVEQCGPLLQRRADDVLAGRSARRQRDADRRDLVTAASVRPARPGPRRRRSCGSARASLATSGSGRSR